MAERFYAPDLAASPDHYVLTDAEAHHLAKVRRSRPGDAVELFDGKGRRAAAIVLAVDRRTVDLQVSLLQGRTPSTAAGLVLGCAMPKGERAAWLVEKCTELGVARLIPLATERSVVSPGETKLDRLRRTVIEACKQCGRDDLMEIGELTAWNEFARAHPLEVVAWMLHPEGDRQSGTAASPASAAIGPEGGWTENEIAAGVEVGWRVVAFPGNVLRIETAAIALAARSIPAI